MATELELRDQIGSIDSRLSQLGGRQGLRGRRDAVRLTERNITQLEDKLQADPNNLFLQADLDNEDRILKENQAEVARLEGEISTLRQQQSEIQKKLDDLRFQNKSTQAQNNSAKGQTAESQVQNTNTPNQIPTPINAEEKKKVEDANSGALASNINQVQDPTAANKQNTASTQGPAPKSEANFEQGAASETNNSVVGKNVTSKSSDYASVTTGTVPENILHRYTSYTYRITLFFLTSKDYNELAASPTTFRPKYALISSAGGYATTMGSLVAEETRTGRADYTQTLRHLDFQTDFFIDNLSMQTVVGLNAKTKASNAIDIGFTITEPYGLSLLDRLLSACETSDDRSVNYMSQPYLLQIDLLASPTDQQLSAQQQSNNVIVSKKLAIKLIDMKIKPTGSGTTYSVKAIPYNHSAFDTNTASLPVPMTVEATTVGEFFADNDDFAQAFTGTIKAEDERIEREIDKWINENIRNNGGRRPSASEIVNERKARKIAITYKTKSLTAAYNSYNENIAKEKKLSKLTPTQITFNIPNDEIRLSRIVNPNASSTTDGSMQNTGTGPSQPDPSGKTKQTFSFEAGRSIIDIVDVIMSKSEYVKQQIQTQGADQNNETAEANYTNNNERTKDEKKPAKLQWYKILPTVALKDFDNTTNTYSKTILYSILPYTAANSYHPNFPKVNSTNVADSVVRKYNYLYTGKNQDILKMDIDFDSSFFTLVTTKGDQVARLGSDAGSDQIDVSEDENGSTKSVLTNLPTTKHFVGSNKASVGTAKASDPDEQTIVDMKTSLYTRSRGDNLNIKLQIIGDPDFIKQDDVFINAGSPEEYDKFLNTRLANNSNRPIAENGQILFDAEQVYVRVDVKNAVDIDDTIGIVNKQDLLSNGRRTDGTFSGIYKVLSVQSEFNRGQFTQTLDLIRIPDALDPPKKPAKNQSQSGKPVTNETVDRDAEAKRGIFANPTIPQPVQPAPVAQTPSQPSQVAQVKQPLTFAEAFRQARKDFGNKPGGLFEWRGKLYQTNYQNEPYVTNPVPVYPGANQ